MINKIKRHLELANKGYFEHMFFAMKIGLKCLWSFITAFVHAINPAWFEYTNKTTHRRHQVWFEDPRSVRAKSEFAHTMGMHGVAFWRGNGVYGGRLDRDNVGVDSADARAMWQAAATAGHAGGGYGGRGFHAHEISLSLKAN